MTPHNQLAEPVAERADIKRLEWRFFDVKHDYGRGVWDANHPYGTFTIQDCAEKYEGDNRFYVCHLSASFATLEDAQEAVFKRHEQCIRSALASPAAISGDGSGAVTEAMIEAFKAKYREFWPGSWPDTETSYELLRAALATAPEGTGGDVAETIKANPKSWIAWKREAERLRKAAEQVCWFDWSDNDPDAVRTIADLRLALTGSSHP